MSARPTAKTQQPWNKGLLVGQKKPLEPKHVWSVRVRPRTRRIEARSCTLQPGDRQQTSCLRPRQVDVWTTFSRDLKFETEQLSSRRRQGDQCNSKSRSNQGIPLKPACRCSDLMARNFSKSLFGPKADLDPREKIVDADTADLSSN